MVALRGIPSTKSRAMLERLSSMGLALASVPDVSFSYDGTAVVGEKLLGSPSVIVGGITACD